MTVEQARQFAKNTLSDERFYHTCCVARMAAEIAGRYDKDVEQAEIAGYLHDIAKEFDKSDLLQMIERSDIIDLDEIAQCQSVWHAYGGGVYARETLGVDEDIADAITYHTTGRAGMTCLEKVLFLADYVSDDREFNNIEDVRELAFESLDAAVTEVIARQIRHLVKHRRGIDPNTIRAYNHLVLQAKKAGEYDI